VVGVRVLSVNAATATLDAGGDFTTMDGTTRDRLAVF
jgi:hypothetical protein